MVKVMKVGDASDNYTIIFEEVLSLLKDLSKDFMLSNNLSPSFYTNVLSVHCANAVGVLCALQDTKEKREEAKKGFIECFLKNMEQSFKKQLEEKNL